MTPHKVEPSPRDRMRHPPEEQAPFRIRLELCNDLNHDRPISCIWIAIKDFTGFHKSQVTVDLRLQDGLVTNGIRPFEVI